MIFVEFPQCEENVHVVACGSFHKQFGRHTPSDFSLFGEFDIEFNAMISWSRGECVVFRNCLFLGFVSRQCSLGRIKKELLILRSRNGEFLFFSELPLIKSISNLKNDRRPFLDTGVFLPLEVLVEECALLFNLFRKVIECPFLNQP
jgi:hypothetical protein